MVKNKKHKAKPRIASSLQVFLSFVDSADDENPQVERIFSKECFEKWMETRQGTIKHPPQAFHRTLISHLRGKDTRKPFPEPIEKQLLNLLRENKSVWNEIFIEGQANVGKHGFRHKGFHEKKSDPEFVDEDDAIIDEEISKAERDPDNQSVCLSQLTRKRKPNSVLVSSAAFAVPYSESSLFIQNVRQQILALKTDHVQFNRQDLRSRKHTTTTQFSDPWARFLFVIETFYSAKRFVAMTDYAQKDGLDLFPPALVFFMKEIPPTTDPRFNYSFCFPDNETTQFIPGRETGRFLICQETAFILESSVEMDRMMGYQLAGLHSTAICSSLLEVWYNFCELIPLLVYEDVVWKRQLYRKANGENGLFLLRYRTNEKHLILDAQEITDLYPGFLKLPYFI